MSTRQIKFARDAGGFALLSIALNGQAMISTWCGDFDTAAALVAEDEALNQVTGQIARYGAMLLATYQGRVAEACTLIEATIKDSVARGEGLGVDLARWTSASSTTASATTRTLCPQPSRPATRHPGPTSPRGCCPSGSKPP